MDLITCPYNVSHQIRPERIQYHLMKCKAQHPEISLLVCPFNAIHHIRQSDQVEHLQNCPDRGIVEMQKFRFNAAVPGQHGNLTTPLVYGSSSITSESQGEDLEVRRNRVETFMKTRERLMEQNRIIQRNKSGQNTPKLTSRAPSRSGNPFQTQSEDGYDADNGSTTDGFDTCNTGNTSFVSVNEDPYSSHLGSQIRSPVSRTRSPSPAASMRSVPRLHRYGRISPRPAPIVGSSTSTISLTSPMARLAISRQTMVAPDLNQKPFQTLRRPRAVFDPRAEMLQNRVSKSPI